MAGTDFSHLTSEELIKGIKALNIPDYIRTKSYGVDVRETLAQMTEMLMQLAYNQGMDPQQAKEWVSQLNNKIVKGQVTMSDLTQEVKEALTGGAVAVVGRNTVLEENIVDGQVTPVKTDFAYDGKNKFDEKYIPGVFTTNAQGRVALIESEGGKVGVIKVERNKNYTISRGEGGDRFRVAVNAGKTEYGPLLTRYVSENDELKKVTVNLQNDEDHILVYVKSSNHDSMPEWVQVEEGDTATTYVPKAPNYKIEERSIGVDFLKGVHSTALLTGAPTSFNMGWGNEEITTAYNGGYINVGTERFTLIDGTWSFKNFPTETIIVAFDPNNRNIVFLTSYDVTNRRYFKLPIIGAIRRDAGICFFNGFYSIDGNIVGQYQDGVNPRERNIPFVITGDEGGEYESNSEFVEFSGLQHTDIYEMYDKQVEDYPEYVSKTLGTYDPNGVPVYCYEFKATTPSTPHGKLNQPKIIYISGIHGHEKSSVMSGALFFKELCENWIENKELRTLRWNVHFVVVPLVNPTGFNNNQRRNANGVDLNRNFSNGWKRDDDLESLSYPGEAPLSEPETQYLDSLMQAHEDAVFAIDSHNFGTYPQQNYALWMGSNVDKTQKLLMGIGIQMASNLKIKLFKLSSVDQVKNLFVISASSDGTTTKQWEKYNVPSALFELPIAIQGSFNHAQSFSMDSLGNLILGAIRNYEKIS